MIKDKKVLAVIPARSGSKGLPGKNIRPLCGKPLIAWTIEAALRATCITDCIVSSDSAEILEVSSQWGARTPFVRPAALAADDSTSVDVLLHALDEMQGVGTGYDFVVMLQPTSPLRHEKDIDCAFARCLTSDAPCCVSLCETDHPPYWTFRMGGSNELIPILQVELTVRQALPMTYRLNGAVYVAATEWLRQTKSFFSPETVGYLMPKKRSVDIDDEMDFHFAEFLMRISE